MNRTAQDRLSPDGLQGRPAILLVDDEQRNLTVVSEALSGLDADVVCVRSGREALRLVLRREFCAILMDVRMPDLDGYETATIIRQREKSRRIPVIFLTAYDKDATQIFRGYSAGAVDYVFKPVEPVVLRAKVSVFIELHRQSDEIRRKAEQERRLLEENLRVRAERMEAELQLRSSEKREAMIIRSLPIAVYEAELAQDGVVRIFLHDDSVKRLLGFDSTDFGSDATLWVSRVHADDWANVLDTLKRVPAGGDYSVEYRWLCADGGYRYFLDQGVVAPIGEDNRSRIFGTMLDVNDRRMLEQQLLHAQKIDAVGKLTGGIVHDFNNMLTVVIGNLDRMQRTKGLDMQTARRVEHALQGALHCRDMTKRLLGFAHEHSLAPQVIDLNELINSLTGLLTRTLGERVDIRRSLAGDLWHIFADPGQVEAAIVNLLVNARDAMTDGGSVRIRTANIEIGQPPSSGHPDLSAGCYVALEIADSGAGMSEEVLARACEPFFTTKEAGHGTGLGLSTIRSFVMQSGGGLAIDSTLGQGTTVRIYLPRHDVATERTGTHPALYERVELPRARDGDVILVTEDDIAVRQTAANTLRELGYRVVEAGNASAALDALQRTEDVRLLFTDVVMPGSANGYQLACEARIRRPDLKILYTSAYGGDVVTNVGEDGLEPFLRKPYRDYELAHAVRNAIDVA